MAVIYLFLFICLLTAGIAGASAAPWLPTRKKELALIHEAIRSLPGNHIVDLGCGDGRILFSLAKAFPENHFTGIELSLAPFLFAFIKARIGGYKNVSIRFGNAFRANLEPFDIIICFLLPKSYTKLRKQLHASAKHDSHLLLEAWPLESLAPMQVIKRETALSVYIYSVSDILPHEVAE
jgi:SAM-dependent methyltransferase